MRTVRNCSEQVADWVSQRLPYASTLGFGNCRAIGVVASNGDPMGGVVFHSYQPQDGTIQMSGAAVSARWLTKSIVTDILSYPFEEIGVFKVWSIVSINNKRAARVCTGLGFIKEATLRHQFGKRDHALFFGMTAPEFRGRYGQKVRRTAAS